MQHTISPPDDRERKFPEQTEPTSDWNQLEVQVVDGFTHLCQELDDLRARMIALTSTVKTQDSQISELQGYMKGNKLAAEETDIFCLDDLVLRRARRERKRKREVDLIVFQWDERVDGAY